MDEKPVLKNEVEFPDAGVLKAVLKENFAFYQELLDSLTRSPYKLDPVWRFYNDGKAWLCKFQYRNKTVFWLSVFDGYFKVAFYFSAGLSEGIDQLDISHDLKAGFETAGFIGKVKPLVVKVMSATDIGDIYSIADYKIKNL